MFLKLTAGFLFLLCLISIIYSIYLFALKLWTYVRENIGKLKDSKNNLSSPVNLIEKIKGVNRSQVKSYILNIITLNTKEKRLFVLYALPISFIFFVPSSFIQFNEYTTIIGFLCVIILLLGIGKFLGRNFKGHFIDRVSDYYFKVSIFVVCSLGFFLGYLENPDNSLYFLISLISTIIFSVYILKSIIDGFNHIGFCVLNILLVYIYDLLVIGLHFGFFYLQNNDIFNLYQDIKQYEDFNLINIFGIIQIGLTNFYTLSSSFGNDSLVNFVPLFEYVFGALFNIGILGFFISYITSKIFAKDNNNDLNIFNSK